MEESKSLKETHVLSIFNYKCLRKVNSKLKLASKLTVVHTAYCNLQFKWYESTWGTLNALNFRQSKNFFENAIFFRRISNKILCKNQKTLGYKLDSIYASYSISQGALGRYKWEFSPNRCHKVTRPLKNTLFSTVFAKKSPAEKNRLQNNSIPLLYDAVKSANQ